MRRRHLRGGDFTGAHLRLVDWNGAFRSADHAASTRVSGGMAVLEGGSPTSAYTLVPPAYGTALTGVSPTTTALRIARRKS